MINLKRSELVEMRFHDLLRLGNSASGENANAAMQSSGSESIADKVTSLNAAAESRSPQPPLSPDQIEVDRIAAAVDLAISLEDE